MIISKMGIAVSMILIFSVLSSFSFHESGQQECILKFEYKVDDTIGGNNNGKIYLKRIEGSGPFTVKLYDMEAGKNEYIKTIRNKNFPVGKMTLVFKGLGPSTYLIKVENGDCSRSVTGIEGILIK
jgi:hypothetical protein